VSLEPYCILQGRLQNIKISEILKRTANNTGGVLDLCIQSIRTKDKSKKDVELINVKL